MIFVFHPTCKRTTAELQPFILNLPYFARTDSPVGFGQIRVWAKIDFIAGEDLQPPRTAAPDTNLIGHCGAPKAQVRIRARKSLPPLAPTRPPKRLLQLTVSSTVARRCASAMVKPAPGGQLTPWKLVAPSTTSASSTGRCAPPCPLQPLAGLAPPRPPHNLIAPTRPARPQLPLCTGFFACLSSSRREGAPLLLFCFVACRLSRASACGASVCVNAACGRSASGASRCVCSLLSLI